MGRLDHLLQRNRLWAERIATTEPQFFSELAQQQAPKILWIGCSDSRVPSTQIVDLPPGEIFVHRNVANVVVHADLNCLSVMQFAVDALGVEDIIVCGHYGCGGVRATLENLRIGLADNWLRHVGDVLGKHRGLLDTLPVDERVDRLCELNVIEQVVNVCQTTVVRDAWERGKPLTVHGWIYGLRDGHIRELGLGVDAPDRLATAYHQAIDAVAANIRNG